MTSISKIQSYLGVKPDGIWGPKSQTALNKEIGHTRDYNNTIELIQVELGVTPDGIWGPKSQSALNDLIGDELFSCKASSFADPADVVAFQKCKKTGKSDVECFKVGDNGIGQFGAITAQEHTNMVALHKDDMVRKWGSVNGAAHRTVRVNSNGRSILATVEDRMSAPGRIDLNPACAKNLSLSPPFVVPCTWQWV